jgi:hypothetical protein
VTIEPFDAAQLDSFVRLSLRACTPPLRERGLPALARRAALQEA